MSQRPPGLPEPADGPRPFDPTAPTRFPSAEANPAPAPARPDAPPSSGQDLATEGGTVPGPDGGGFVAQPTTRRDRRRAEREKRRRGPLGFLRELPVLILVAFLLALLIKTFLIQAFYIPSQSMEPTLQVGDRVLVNKVVYHLHAPRRGDVIVFENPTPGAEPDRGALSAFWHWITEGLGFSAPADKDFIKRVIGLPGETVEQRNGDIYINGRKLDEPWLPQNRDRRTFPPKVVPEGHLWVLGDNRENSNDSRFPTLGFIPMDRVVGKAFVIIWPPSRIGWLRGG